MNRVKRRIKNGFGYIGFGNSQSVFNQKNNRPFSVLKEQLNNESHFHYEIHFTHKNLSKLEKDIIKNNIRKDAKRQNIKTVVVSTILFILVLLLIKYLINNFTSRI
ncbi:hypothetical protein [Siansivirga zeaxanthinifaciens]|uniref:Uncharacterized protein n=1 Tax=Siansivirga zeaxanthinifaciens CC-SAMT-1 TaxID=1454006 RepID=A0A0C5WIC8_9FLAO|nr:hypothetical protein [Siansivirga zeaxanthinifaciens]AJR04919.1 hypothetical protein AW14_10010 [Siansivirga zeaxanthinifaciens CC-SAMT-1]